MYWPVACMSCLVRRIYIGSPWLDRQKDRCLFLFCLALNVACMLQQHVAGWAVGTDILRVVGTVEGPEPMRAVGEPFGCNGTWFWYGWGTTIGGMENWTVAMQGKACILLFELRLGLDKSADLPGMDPQPQVEHSSNYWQSCISIHIIWYDCNPIQCLASHEFLNSLH
jgi:hypothetical protein